MEHKVRFKFLKILLEVFITHVITEKVVQLSAFEVIIKLNIFTLIVECRLFKQIKKLCVRTWSSKILAAFFFYTAVNVCAQKFKINVACICCRKSLSLLIRKPICSNLFLRIVIAIQYSRFFTIPKIKIKYIRDKIQILFHLKIMRYWYDVLKLPYRFVSSSRTHVG